MSCEAASSKAYDKGCEKGCEEGSRFPLVGKRRTEAHYVKHNESREKREGGGWGSVVESAKGARTHGERETSAKSATVVDSERENRMRIRGRSRECRGRRLSARTNERETLGVNSTLLYLWSSVYYIERGPGGRTNKEKQ